MAGGDMEDEMKVVNFRLPKELLRMLKANLALEGRTLQEFFEEYVHSYITKKSKSNDFMVTESAEYKLGNHGKAVGE
jgi:hypothetical protein